MKVVIDPNKITLLNTDEGCPIPTKTSRSPSRISGGSLTRKRNRDPATRTSAPQDIFLLVDSQGMPFQASKSEKNLPIKTYYAKKPSLAAIKAYYAYVRSQNLEKHKMDNHGLDLIESNVTNVASRFEIDAYMKKVRNTYAEPDLVLYLRRPESNRVMKYLVGYERVSNPNRHEIMHGITKVAKAHRL